MHTPRINIDVGRVLPLGYRAATATSQNRSPGCLNVLCYVLMGMCHTQSDMVMAVSIIFLREVVSLWFVAAGWEIVVSI